MIERIDIHSEQHRSDGIHSEIDHRVDFIGNALASDWRHFKFHFEIVCAGWNAVNDGGNTIENETGRTLILTVNKQSNLCLTGTRDSISNAFESEIGIHGHKGALDQRG